MFVLLNNFDTSIVIYLKFEKDSRIDYLEMQLQHFYWREIFKVILNTRL